MVTGEAESGVLDFQRGIVTTLGWAKPSPKALEALQGKGSKIWRLSYANQSTWRSIKPADPRPLWSRLKAHRAHIVDDLLENSWDHTFTMLHNMFLGDGQERRQYRKASTRRISYIINQFSAGEKWTKETGSEDERSPEGAVAN